MKGALCTRLSRLESSAEMAIACSAVNPPAKSSPIEQISQLQDSTLAILRRAQATGRTDTALRVIREARSNMEFMARLTGDP
jgi:hypothetical protein